jgi:membrane-bound lytic murein transglycosylase A
VVDEPRAAMSGPGGSRLEPVTWEALDGFDDDDCLEAYRVFRAFCAARRDGRGPTRPGRSDSSPEFESVCARALEPEPARTRAEARAFFVSAFRPWRVALPAGEGFLTGYYEPEIDGALAPSVDFAAPLLARPADLVPVPPAETLADPAGVPLTASRRAPDGSLVAYPDRSAIEWGAIDDRTRPLVWVHDAVEAFFVHVQGSARVRLADGTVLRLAYDGRNGHPYTSIGRLLAQERHMSPGELTLGRLKDILRAEPDAGRALMRRNRSYIFFRRQEHLDPTGGPLGGAGVPLTPLRSLAVDRKLWPYGAPFWIDAVLPWRSSTDEPFRRLLIAQDTGSAIVGAARGDLFFGTGAEAGARAGAVRHPARFTVLLPTGARS